MMRDSLFDDNVRKPRLTPERFVTLYVVGTHKDEDVIYAQAVDYGLDWPDVKQQVGLHRCEVCGVWLYEEMMCGGGVCELCE